MLPTPMAVRGVVPVPARSNVLPAPRISDALVLLRATWKLGVRTVVVPPAAVVSRMFAPEASSCWLREPAESPTRNAVPAVIVLLLGNSILATLTVLLLATTPTLIVPKLAVKLLAADASSAPVALTVGEKPTFRTPLPSPKEGLDPAANASVPPLVLVPTSTLRSPSVALDSVATPAPCLLSVPAPMIAGEKVKLSERFRTSAPELAT